MKISIKKTVAAGIIVAIFIVAAIVFLQIEGAKRKVDGKKCYFKFPERGSEKLIREVRYLQHDAPQGELNYYVDELLLGPQTPRLRPLFSLGTSVEYCFQKNSTLYVGLSKEAVLQMSDSTDIRTGVKLLKENINANSKNINKIELFVDGKYLE